MKGRKKQIRQLLCKLNGGHRKYTVNPKNYIGWAKDEHKGEVPIWICENCGAQKWVDDEMVK